MCKRKSTIPFLNREERADGPRCRIKQHRIAGRGERRRVRKKNRRCRRRKCAMKHYNNIVDDGDVGSGGDATAAEEEAVEYHSSGHIDAS